VLVVAGSTLTVGVVSTLAPSQAIVHASAASVSAEYSTVSGAATAAGTAAVVDAAVAVPQARLTATVVAPRTTTATRTVRTAMVAPYRFGTVAYSQWWAKRLMAQRYGWKSTAQFRCLVTLWSYESHWNYRAHNYRSGAHGIPQALPGSKMRHAGRDWRTNPVTQVIWGLGYVKGRYGTPCGAMSHYRRHGWY
jgi:hypothetical protein